MIPAIVVLVYYDRIHRGRQFFYILQYVVFFFKARIASAVDTETHHPAAFQYCQTFLNCSHTGPGVCCNAVVSAGKISEVKAYNVRCLFL